MIRVISYTEISTALDCFAKHDFAYGDQLAGSSLKEKAISPLLSGGRAWGAAVATYHVNVGHLDAGQQAIEAMDASLEADAEQQREFGVHDQEAHDELRIKLLRMLLHYIDTAEPILMDPVLEAELLVPIPSRGGDRMSNRYKLLCYLDATESETDGVWIDEFKLRGNLTDVRLITLSRQIRWYAWAYQELHGIRVKGVYVNERLNEAPKPARILASGKPSHAKDQMCTANAYVTACMEHGEKPHDDVTEALAARRWQQRVPVMFRDDELELTGRELVGAAKLIQMLDTGAMEPLRNPKRANCSWCSFRDICPAPDNDLVDALFERRPPKRDRDPDETTLRAQS